MTTVNGIEPEDNNSFGDAEGSIGSANDSAALNSEEYTPCVRYAVVEDGEFSQRSRLASVEEDPPEKAKFASQIVYYVSEEQSKRLYEGTPPKTIQRECQEDDGAFFQVVAESDALEDSVEGETVAKWLREFAEDYVETDNYDLYFSGNRSLHLHTDKWVQYEDLEDLKSLAESFNRETGGELDTSIYKGIPQFRLPGAEHEDTGLYKVPIQEDFSRANLVKQAQSEPSNNASKHSSLEHHSHYVATIADTGSLLPEIRNRLLSPLIKESTGVEETWAGKPFSPYALTGGGDYSVCLMSFCEMVERDSKHYARGYVLEAIGGNGQFTRHNSYSEVRLSGHDAEKWDFEPGVSVVIIGGRSRKSKLIEVDTDETLLLDTELQESGREAAIDLLQRWGHDTGDKERNRGLIEGNYGDDSGETEASDTARLKWAIDSGRRTPSYDDCLRVACRLLRIEGWQAAWDWFDRTMGDDFDPEDTHNRLETLVETYDDSFGDVTVPNYSEATEEDITERNI